MGRSCDDLYYWCRSLFKYPHEFSPDPEIPLCHQNDHWPHLPQKGCLRRRDDSVPGSVYGAGRYRRHRQHRRRGRRDRHRRAGRGVLDVVLCAAGHVYQVLRSDAGRAFPRAEQKRRAGGRPHVLY